MGNALVNQVATDFQSLETELIVNGASVMSFGIIDGLDKFDYGVTVNRTEIYGRSRLPVAATEGDAQFDGSIDVYEYWWNRIVDGANNLGVGLGNLVMTLVFTKFVDAQTLRTDTCVGVMFKEIKKSGQHGPDPLMVSVPLRIGNIYFGGIDIFGNKL